MIIPNNLETLAQIVLLATDYCDAHIEAIGWPDSNRKYILNMNMNIE